MGWVDRILVSLGTNEFAHTRWKAELYTDVVCCERKTIRKTVNFTFCGYFSAKPYGRGKCVDEVGALGGFSVKNRHALLPFLDAIHKIRTDIRNLSMRIIHIITEIVSLVSYLVVQ